MMMTAKTVYEMIDDLYNQTNNLRFEIQMMKIKEENRRKQETGEGYMEERFSMENIRETQFNDRENDPCVMELRKALYNKYKGREGAYSETKAKIKAEEDSDGK